LLAEADLAKRSGLIATAQRLSVADFGFVPTHYQLNLLATKRNLRR